MDVLTGIVDHISIEFLLFLIVYITSIVRVIFYYKKKNKELGIELKQDMDIKLKDSYEKHETSVCNRFEKVEMEMDTVKDKQDKTEEQFKELSGKMDKLMISIAEIRTFVKGSLNGNSNGKD